jgi:hypothetical protein
MGIFVEASGKSSDSLFEVEEGFCTDSVLDFGMDLGDEADELRVVLGKFGDGGRGGAVEEEESDVAVGVWVIGEEVLGGISLGRETDFERGNLLAIDSAELDGEVMGLGIWH